MFPQIAEEVFHFQEHAFQQKRKKKKVIDPAHAEVAWLDDMIALVWFVSRFCVTDVFGHASSPSSRWLFHVSIFILERFNLNRDGLLVYCGNFTMIILCHGISFVCICITQVWVCG